MVNAYLCFRSLIRRCIADLSFSGNTSLVAIISTRFSSLRISVCRPLMTNCRFYNNKIIFQIIKNPQHEKKNLNESLERRSNWYVRRVIKVHLCWYNNNYDINLNFCPIHKKTLQYMLTRNILYTSVFLRHHHMFGNLNNLYFVRRKSIYKP